MSSKQDLRKNLNEPEIPNKQVINSKYRNLRKRKNEHNTAVLNPKKFQINQSNEEQVSDNNSKDLKQKVITPVFNSHVVERIDEIKCPSCCNEFKCSSDYAQHICLKRNNHIKSAAVKLDKLTHTPKKVKSKLKLNVQPEINTTALTRKKDNTNERCGRCCTEFETSAELSKHDCDRILLNMKSCVVKLYNLPLFPTNVQITQKSNATTVTGNKSNININCPRCYSECKTFAEYAEHPCEKVLDNMKFCVVVLDSLLFDVNSRGNFTFFECTQCKRVFINEYLVNDHISFKTIEICKKNIKTITLHVNEYPKTTTHSLDDINNCKLAQYTHQPVSDVVSSKSNVSFPQTSEGLSSNMFNPVTSSSLYDKEDSESGCNYVSASPCANILLEGSSPKVHKSLSSNTVNETTMIQSVNTNNGDCNTVNSQYNALPETNNSSSEVSQLKGSNCCLF